MENLKNSETIKTLTIGSGKSQWQQSEPRLKIQRRQAGSAALEYVLVSTFGLLAAVAAIGFVGKMFKDRLEQMSEKLGIESEEFDIDVFPQ